MLIIYFALILAGKGAFFAFYLELVLLIPHVKYLLDSEDTLLCISLDLPFLCTSQ